MNKKWLKASLDRAIRTVAQTSIALLGSATFIEQVNFEAVLSACLLAGLLSMMTSLAGLPEIDGDK